MGDNIPVELTQYVNLAVSKDVVVPNDFIRRIKANSNSGGWYVPYKGEKNGKFESYFLFNKLGLSLDDADEITRWFRQGENVIDNLKDFADKDSNVSETSYYGIRYKDLEEDYYLLHASYSYYDSGAIEDDGNYENTAFYKFFVKEMSLDLFRDHIERPETFLNGKLIILQSQFGGF